MDETSDVWSTKQLSLSLTLASSPGVGLIRRSDVVAFGSVVTSGLKKLKEEGKLSSTRKSIIAGRGKGKKINLKPSQYMYVCW